ncbi:MAG: hypothetical protein NTV97_07305 [Alphaproteobacteria bacterium]|nr:hypothetical protein [Alphaproteobacteria bacterium]
MTVKNSCQIRIENLVRGVEIAFQRSARPMLGDEPGDFRLYRVAGL